MRYPLPKYDQLWVPDFNAGAMENFGCVTHAESAYIFRSHVTDLEFEQRANTILHEMAHMWFGDLVTMRWWDDLWLNESFAEWASHWCNSEATRFTDAWTTFLSIRKNWGYRQDQLSSTHPVYCDMPDMDAVEVNFDGITYAKGASVIKQLVAYVGQDAFLTGLRSYFADHAWGNATFNDLLSALEEASGRPLREFAAQWLETAQVNTLRPAVEFGADGTYAAVAVLQEAPADYPNLRTHRIAVGLYDLVDGQLLRRDRVELDVSGARTEVPALTGVPAADVLLLNDDDLTYTKLRLDERSMSTVVEHIAGFESPLARGLCWAAAWDMVRDAELPARDYVKLVCAGLPGRDRNQPRHGDVAAGQRRDRPLRRLGLDAQLAGSCSPTAPRPRSPRRRRAATCNWHGHGRSPARPDPKTTWLRCEAGLMEPACQTGLAIDTEFRWSLLFALVANGKAGATDIEAELDRDRTASGERSAALAQALIPTPASKEETWRRLTGEEKLPNTLQRSLLHGFHHSSQLDLTEPYISKYFGVIDEIWATRDSEPAQEFVEDAYPSLHISQATVDATDAWLAVEGHPVTLRRLVVEGRDGVVRALAARAKDVASA